VPGPGRRESTGVLPSFPSALGRLTPRTGLWLTALASHRWSNNEATAASLRRMELGARPRRSRSFRQAIPVRAGDLAHFLGTLDAGERSKVPDVQAVGAPGAGGVEGERTTPARAGSRPSPGAQSGSGACPPVPRRSPGNRCRTVLRGDPRIKCSNRCTQIGRILQPLLRKGVPSDRSF